MQRLARRHFKNRDGSVAIAPRLAARGPQFRDDPIEVPVRSGRAVVAVVLSGHAHAARPLALKTPSNRVVLRYRSPESGSTTTMVLPSLDGRLAIRAATATAAPHEMPD